MKSLVREDVQRAVDSLIVRQRLRMTTVEGRSEWHTLPSLWEQLVSSDGWAGGGSGGGAYGSRPVIATGIVSLLTEIRDTCNKGAAELSDNPPDKRARDAVNAARRSRALTTDVRDRALALAALADKCISNAEAALELKADNTDELVAKARQKTEEANAAGAVAEQFLADHERIKAAATAAVANCTPLALRLIAATITDQLDIIWWTEHIRAWEARAKAELGADPVLVRSAWRFRCPVCLADEATIVQDGQKVKTSALMILWAAPTGEGMHLESDWKVRAIECRQCGQTWWRGAGLEQLADQLLDAKQPKAVAL